MMASERKESAAPVVLFAVLHLLCCGLPLLILSGASLGFVLPHWPVIAAALAALGVAGFAWYLDCGCATCPRNEGRCQLKTDNVRPEAK